MNPALLSAFKSQVAVLVDHCRLEPVQIVSAGMSLAASQALKSGLDYDRLHLALDEAILKSPAALIDGAEKALASIKEAGGIAPTEPVVKLNG